VEHTLQQFVWNNFVSIVNDIDEEVDAILEHITVPAIDNIDDESIADIIGTKGDTPKTDLTATIMNNLKALFASSLSKRIRISEVVNATSFKTTDLPALGTGGLINWYVLCSLDAGGLGAAPQGEYRKITNWVNGASGTFTHEAFSVPLEVTDKVILIHESIYNSVVTLAVALSTNTKLAKPVANVVTDATIAEVVGIKEDAAVVTVSAVASIVGYVKGILTNLNLVKVETDKIPATITKIDTINTNTTPKRQSVYPTLTTGINVVAGASWVLSAAHVQVVPANTITSPFKIIGINPAVVSANDVYEVVLYAGTAGNEVEIGRTRVTKVGNNNYSFISLPTAIQPANTRITVKLASASGGDNMTISLEYLL